MKTRTLTLLALAIFCSASLSAQLRLPARSVANPATLFGMNVKSVGVSFGKDEDRLGDLNRDYLMGKVKGNLSTDLQRFEAVDIDRLQAYGMTCENPHLRVDVALQPLTMPNAELRLAIVGIANRIDAVTYGTESTTGSRWWHNSDEYLSITEYSNEFALETALLWQAPTKGTFLNVYGGAGMNVGATFASALSFRGSQRLTVADNSLGFGEIADRNNDAFSDQDYEYFSEFESDVKESFNHRLFLQGGIGFNLFRRFEIGVEGRWGYGYRATGGTPLQVTNLRSLALSTRWNFIN